MTHDPRVSTVSSPVSHGGDTNALPGMFFLSVIPGMVGRAASAAQAFARGGSLWTHAGIYVGDGQIVQAEPGGVRLRSLPDKLAADPLLWSDAPIQRHLATLGLRPGGSQGDDEVVLRQRVVDAAHALVSSPYAWLDYLTIAGAEWRVPGWERLRGRVDKAGALLCSSLVDRAYAEADIHLFTDKRPVGQVTPGDLARLDEAWVRTRLADLEQRVADVERKLS